MDGDDDDIARLLPDPPPPRPARRDAAIALAMRKFDGTEQTAPASPPYRTPEPTRWWAERRTQVGAFASIALVAIVAVPLALERPGGTLTGSDQPAPAVEHPMAADAPSVPAAPRATGKQNRQVAQAQTAPRTAIEPADKAVSPAGLVADAGQDVALREEARAAPAFAPQARTASRGEPLPGEPIVVTGSRIAARPMESATAVTVVANESLDGAESVVVTGTRRSHARKAEQRGDWNACTINDPARSLRRCRQLVDPAAKGDAGVAAAHLADGLTRGWEGDWSDAIAALDRAIALRPRFAIAYLNRGLAHAREDALDKALADLDQAVRYAPRAARSYYNRSLVRRMRGDERGADADLARAEGLDSSYVGLGD